MALQMSEFQGMDQNYITTLRVAGIQTTDDLMKIWMDKPKRADLIRATGISEEKFMKFAAMARLSQVKGMTMQHLGILVAAGIDGPKRLFSFTPGTLLKHLEGVVAEKKFVGAVPTLDDIATWYAHPKPEHRAADFRGR